MKGIVAGVLSAALVVAFTGTATAKSGKKEFVRYDSYAARYPSATKRQLRNAWAYDNGGYYERDSDAHPVGSRGWWELKDQESDGRDGTRF